MKAMYMTKERMLKKGRKIKSGRKGRKVIVAAAASFYFLFDLGLAFGGDFGFVAGDGAGNLPSLMTWARKAAAGRGWRSPVIGSKPARP